MYIFLPKRETRLLNRKCNYGGLNGNNSKSFERENLIMRDYWSIYITGDTGEAFCLRWNWTCLLFPYVCMWVDMGKENRVASWWLRNVRKCEKKTASKENGKRSQEWNARSNVKMGIHSTCVFRNASEWIKLFFSLTEFIL